MPPQVAGTGLERIPPFGATPSAYRDVVVESHLGRRLWAPDRFVTVGGWVTIEGSQWQIVANAEDPSGPPTPVHGDCGVEYVDQHEALLLLL